MSLFAMTSVFGVIQMCIAHTIAHLSNYTTIQVANTVTCVL